MTAKPVFMEKVHKQTFMLDVLGSDLPSFPLTPLVLLKLLFLFLTCNFIAMVSSPQSEYASFTR